MGIFLSLIMTITRDIFHRSESFDITVYYNAY